MMHRWSRERTALRKAQVRVPVECETVRISHDSLLSVTEPVYNLATES